MSPGLAPSGTGTVISPVFGSTFTPSGAFSPGLKVVPSGALVSLPSLSLKLGAGTLASSPGLPEPSSYLGSKFSLSLAAGAARLNFAGTSRVAGSAPSTGVHVTFTSTSFSPSTCLSLGQVIAPVLGSMSRPKALAAAGSANAKDAPSGIFSAASVFGLSKDGFTTRSFS